MYEEIPNFKFCSKWKAHAQTNAEIEQRIFSNPCRSEGGQVGQMLIR